MNPRATQTHYKSGSRKIERDPLWTLPNALTLMRIVLVPLILVIMLTRLQGLEFLVLSLFWLASITDWLDGYLARRRGQMSSLGAMLDPLADKILVSSIFIAFVEIGLAPAWMVTIIVARELSITGLRSMAATQAFIMHARHLGKAKMVFQIVCISALLLGHRFGPKLMVIGKATLWGVVLISLVSMLDYIIQFIRSSRRTPDD